MATRTQDEIVERLKASKADFFGFSTEVLVPTLDFEHARPWLKPDTKSEDWPPHKTSDELRKEALDYLAFAWGKAEDHRGLSAGRSVDKMTEYCWLLGFDTKSIDDAEYAQYGCPKLKACAELLGVPLPTTPELVRMMRGEPCIDGCGNGCGQ